MPDTDERLALRKSGRPQILKAVHFSSPTSSSCRTPLAEQYLLQPQQLCPGRSRKRRQSRRCFGPSFQWRLESCAWLLGTEGPERDSLRCVQQLRARRAGQELLFAWQRQRGRFSRRRWWRTCQRRRWWTQRWRSPVSTAPSKFLTAPQTLKWRDNVCG